MVAGQRRQIRQVDRTDMELFTRAAALAPRAFLIDVQATDGLERRRLVARAVVELMLPVIQVRDVAPGESVGYGNAHVARVPTRVATVAAGYADGIHRALAAKGAVWAGDTRCKIIGRVSMDLITVDVTALNKVPEQLELLGRHQTVDMVADAVGTIGYEILTGLGARYARVYTGA